MSETKRQVTIITASSNSGKYCIDELFTRYPNQVHVKAAFRSEEKARSFREKYPGIEIVSGVDAEKPETLSPAFQGSHSALIVTTHDDTRGFDKDAELTCNMINAAVQTGVKYIVFVGSFTVNNMERMSVIAFRFKPCEDLLEKFGKEIGIKWTSLRGGCFMENMLPMAEKFDANPLIMFPNINVPLIDTRDIGKSGAACLVASNIDEHHGMFYEMNGPEFVSSPDLAKIYSKVLGKEIKYQELPKESISKFMPPNVAPSFEFMVEAGKNAAPFKHDVKKLTGTDGYTFEEFLKFHLSK